MSITNNALVKFFGTLWLVLYGWALGQLWLFWLAPIIGALLAGFGFHFIVGKAKA